jgi:hypothetical protein
MLLQLSHGNCAWASTPYSESMLDRNGHSILLQERLTTWKAADSQQVWVSIAEAEGIRIMTERLNESRIRAAD